MGVFGIMKKMAKIDSECKRDEVLRKKLEPWVEEMNKRKTKSKAEALKMSQDFIDKYNEIKKQINSDICSEVDRRNNEKSGSVCKIEQINER